MSESQFPKIINISDFSLRKEFDDLYLLTNSEEETKLIISKFLESFDFENKINNKILELKNILNDKYMIEEIDKIIGMNKSSLLSERELKLLEKLKDEFRKRYEIKEDVKNQINTEIIEFQDFLNDYKKNLLNTQDIKEFLYDIFDICIHFIKLDNITVFEKNEKEI